MPSDPFEEDTLVCILAEKHGLELTRYDTIEITDEAAIKAAGWMRQTPDYSRIRKAMRDGGIVPGVRQGGVQYKLKRKAISE